ncbi:hypothetical protein PV325_002733, partial [Microctonus aethiopoides]
IIIPLILKMKKTKTGKIVKKTNNKKKVPKVKKHLSEVTADEFLDQNFEAENSDENVDNNVNDNDGSESGESDLDEVSHKESLKKLQETDPEFFKFLQDNDRKLLKFNVSEEDKLSGDEEDLHVPDDNLEVASDESDFEGEEVIKNEATKGRTKITLKLLKSWQEEIKTDRTVKTIRSVVDAFHAALITISDPDATKNLPYKVDGGLIFNGVVQLCLLNLPTAFKQFLNIETLVGSEIHKSKRFPKLKGVLKSYLADLLKILQNVTSSDILTVLLKHLHQMIPYTHSFSSLNKPLMRILLKLWSTGEETVRVVAFLNILQIATSRNETILDTLMKTMYIKYVENSKFVSPNTLPGINFMKHSLAEIYMLNQSLAYNHAFLYIRQLAIHLRNAMTLKKKENFQTVYNWQYINSLRFWCDLITLSRGQSALRSLIYPLVQIITGTIKLIPTSQFYPLRFHCVQMLINISKETGTFIPTLPFLLEILTAYDFNKKHKAVSMKPISTICLLRMSKAQLQENAFKDSVIDNIYQLILESATKDSHMIHFPDTYVPCIIQLKAFLKKCKVANFCKKMKQLLDKIQENRQFVETERNKIIVDLSDMAEIKNWENRLKNQGTPLATFYKSWYNLHQSQKLKLLTQNDDLANYKLPTLKKSRKKKRNDHDSDDNSDLDMPVEEMNKLLEKQEKKKNKKKKVHAIENNEDISTIENSDDIVNDMDVEDWK